MRACRGLLSAAARLDSAGGPRQPWVGAHVDLSRRGPWLGGSVGMRFWHPHRACLPLVVGTCARWLQSAPAAECLHIVQQRNHRDRQTAPLPRAGAGRTASRRPELPAARARSWTLPPPTAACSSPKQASERKSESEKCGTRERRRNPSLREAPSECAAQATRKQEWSIVHP